MHPVEKQFGQLVKNYSMLDTPSVLLAYSGGADSSVLLHLLVKARKKYGFSLTCVHVNHMIRANEADRDEDFCKRTCDSLGIPLIVVKKDVPSLAASQGQGLEEAAREFRYRVFDEICQRLDIKTVATAHNATDNAETVIFNLCRGSGIKGASGIAPVRDNIIRPILLSDKEQILEYAAQNGIEFVYDSTNSDSAYTRNFIRAEIIPRLKEVNSCAVDAISRSSLTLRNDCEYLDRIADMHCNVSSVKELASLDDVILSRTLRKRFSLEFSTELDHQNVSDVIGLIRKNPPYASVSLPKDVDAIVENGVFRFGKREIQKEHGYFEIPLLEGENPCPQADSLIYVSFESPERNKEYIESKQNIYKLFISKSLVFDRIVGDMFARSRKDSDRYLINGINRSVKKYMCDEKYPKELRFSMPFICDGHGIAWIPGMRERDGLHPIDPTHEKLVHIYVFKNKKV